LIPLPEGPLFGGKVLWVLSAESVSYPVFLIAWGLKNMKILQISTYDISGGAARAAYRFQKGLRETGHDCRMPFKHKHTEDPYSYKISSELDGEAFLRDFFLNRVIQEHYIQNHRTEKSNTMFSLPYHGYNLTGVSALNEADVINLHWIAQYQSPVTFAKLRSLAKPVVWALHDQWASTGGCIIR
jgi:hypothetical protein